MRFTRPTRGGVRLDQLAFDPSGLRTDLARFGDQDWISRAYGTEWAEVRLIDKERHPLLDSCPSFLEVLDAFPGRPIDMVLARLDPGGAIQEHRDFSGGVPMGVGRFHVPIVTSQDVEFYVSGTRVYMGEGEVWNLDTTYPHRVANNSDVRRVHLILDVELTSGVKALLPPTDLRDRAHDLHFAALCVQKGVGLAVSDPRALAKRVKNFVRLKFLRQSVLND